MKKPVLAGLFCAGLAVAAGSALADDGTVVAAPGMACSDYFAVKTGDEYVLLEWFSGPKPDKGDKVSGEFDSFGFKDIALQPGGRLIHVWVEDYGLNLDDANDKLQGKCQ